MKLPQRIQRKRTKGWKQPENTCYCGRGSKWGDPIILIGCFIYIRKPLGDGKFYRKYYTIGDIDDVLNLFRHIINGTQFMDKDLQYWSDHFAKLDLTELLNYDYLSCWCPLDQKCHIDILISKLKEIRQ